MATELILPGLGLVLVCSALLGSFLQTRPRALPPAADAVRTGEAPNSLTLARVRAGIEAVGWHLVSVRGRGRAGCLLTIGLWQSYRHPEILVFADEEDPRGLGSLVNDLARRVADGQELEDGDLIAGAFDRHPGFVRQVRPRWFASVLAAASGYYEGNRFPAIQLYRPDEAGLFPWHSDFDSNLFGRQPLLYQDNVILAGVGYEEILRLTAATGARVFDEATDDLCVPLAASEPEDLLACWRWKIGPEARIVRVTVFGDVLLRMADGRLHWLATGSNELLELAEDVETCRRVLCNCAATVFYASTLLHLRELDVSIAAGEVYDWIREPMAGGRYSADNVHGVDLRTHLSSTGRFARLLTTG